MPATASRIRSPGTEWVETERPGAGGPRSTPHSWASWGPDPGGPARPSEADLGRAVVLHPKGAGTGNGVWPHTEGLARPGAPSLGLKSPRRSQQALQDKGGHGSCADAEDAGSPSCGSQALACAQPHCSPRRPAAGQPQAAYAQRLANMEWELESFLHEVRQQRCVLGEAAAEGSGPHSPTWDPDKLRITIYEIADREAAAGGERTGQRRRLK
ncbi:uncharacterized protein LOC123019618 [Varanus komodoensis]|uniref:uncharacterized protein LOC123019618 n=1 Tax=Varanus komodoensis TaxID=61221 RepID=UPI001CF78776|nr:uncharacterized protein LOC123019618 [Varanus komodoensis]